MSGWRGLVVGAACGVLAAAAGFGALVLAVLVSDTDDEPRSWAKEGRR